MIRFYDFTDVIPRFHRAVLDSGEGDDGEGEERMVGLV
jgi:hypothetical protein